MVLSLKLILLLHKTFFQVHQMPYFYQNSHPQLVNPYTAAYNPLGYSRFGPGEKKLYQTRLTFLNELQFYVPAPLTAFGALRHAQQTGAFKMPHVRLYIEIIMGSFIIMGKSTCLNKQNE